MVSAATGTWGRPNEVAVMEDMRRYGGVRFSERRFHEAAVAMMREDACQRDIPREVDHYRILLDKALRELFLVTVCS